MILHRYFGRQFLVSFFRSLLIITVLILVVDTLEHIRSLAGHDVSFSSTVKLVALKTPGFVNLALPVIFLIGSLTFCVALARSNEFVVARACGVSALRCMSFPIASAFTLGLLVVLFLNPLVAILNSQYSQQITKIRDPDIQQLSISQEGFWLRQKNADGHTVLHAASANSKGTLLRAVSATDFDENGDAKRRIIARTAVLYEDAWIFARGKQWDITRANENPEQSSQEFSILRLPTTITPAQILNGYPDPETLSIWELPTFISVMERAGFSSIRHRVHYHIEMARPFLFSAMVLIGAAFTLQTRRLGNLGLSVLIALVGGFSLHFFQNLTRTLGEAGEVPVIVAAWFPPAASILLALGYILYLEDG